MPDSLLSQGLMLMLTGMGTVFVFLSVLVVAMSALSRLVGGEPPPVDTDPDDETVAAISAAIAQHRRRQS